MAGSTRTFTYTLRPAQEDVEDAFRRAAKVLGWACDGDKRIECHGVSGEGFGVVILNLTIRARDQWAVRQIGQDVVNLVTWGLANPADFEAGSVRQEPHTARGYARGGRTKRFRERKVT